IFHDASCSPRGVGGQEQAARDLWPERVRRSRRPHAVWYALSRLVQACSPVRGQDPEGRQAGRPPSRAADKVRVGHQSQDREDFLWFMSSDFFLTLSQLLPRHHRQVVLLVIRDLSLPHNEDDLQPLRAQGAERLAIRMTPRALPGVVRVGPLAPAQREEGHVVDDVAQRLYAGTAEPDTLLLAPANRHRHPPTLTLKIPNPLPPARRNPQAGPERG